MAGVARVGCSGWVYRDWRGTVYPEGLRQRDWFAHYASLFDTVELNSTFYRLPSVDAVERWAHQAPPGFTYSLKLGSFGSHRMKLRDPTSWLPNHVDRARRLGPALGPTLVQLPPRWHRDTDRLDEFLAAATTAGDPCPSWPRASAARQRTGLSSSLRAASSASTDAWNGCPSLPKASAAR